MKDEIKILLQSAVTCILVLVSNENIKGNMNLGSNETILELLEPSSFLT